MKNNNENPCFHGRKLNVILEKIMRETYTTISKLSLNTGVAKPTIIRLLNDPSANPTVSTLFPIANYFCLSINQLIGESPLPKKLMGYRENRLNWTNIPLISWHTAINIELLKENTYIEHIATDLEISANGFALPVIEDDWIGFLKGSVLIIDPAIKPESKDYVVVHKTNHNTATFKQYLVDENASYLKPLNLDYRTVTFDETYKIIGVLIQVRNDMRLSKEI